MDYPQGFQDMFIQAELFRPEVLAALGVVQVLGPVVWNQARGAPETDGSGLV